MQEYIANNTIQAMREDKQVIYLPETRFTMADEEAAYLVRLNAARPANPIYVATVAPVEPFQAPVELTTPDLPELDELPLDGDLVAAADVPDVAPVIKTPRKTKTVAE